ncbi:MAG: cytochrome b561 [Flavobacteriales bacterium]|jgi:cytochrome b561
MNNTPKLSRTTISLHWLVAIFMIGLASIGLIMKYWEVWALYPIHKSLGVLALLIILPRVIWRLKKGWPKPARKGQAYEQILAKVTHWVLISATLIMPLSGMILSWGSGHGFGIFGLNVVPTNHSSINPEEVVPYSETFANIGYILHPWVGYLLVGAVVLHVLGAIKHHVYDKDATFKRIIGKN